jgi:hypothetical protein
MLFNPILTSALLTVLKKRRIFETEASSRATSTSVLQIVKLPVIAKARISSGINSSAIAKLHFRIPSHATCRPESGSYTSLPRRWTPAMPTMITVIFCDLLIFGVVRYIDYDYSHIL